MRVLRGGGGGGGGERKKWGKNNFLESPPNPSPKISDIPSANVLIRGETSLFHGAIFHALTNQPVREPGVVRRGLWRGGWGLLGRGPGQGAGGWCSGRRAQGESRKVEDRICPGPTQVQNILPAILGPARWMVGLRGRTQAGISYVCHFRAWCVEGYAAKFFV